MVKTARLHAAEKQRTSEGTDRISRPNGTSSGYSPRLASAGEFLGYPRRKGVERFDLTPGRGGPCLLPFAFELAGMWTRLS
jgi:hypothetical protein